jgi:prepilin-type N-terminal cleavage/methylation domain-containing protein
VSRPRRTRSRPARDANGFTLIELVVVLAVLAVVTAFAVPSIRRGSEGLRLRAGAGRVASLLREARLQAVTHRRPARVVLDTNRHGAALAWEGADEPLRRVELPERFRLEAASGGETLTFSPRGLVRDARWVIEGPGGRRLVVEVHGVTGRVAVAAPSP